MPRARHGYTLLEALVALALLAGIAGTALEVLTTGTRHAHEGAFRLRAVLAAEELLARARLEVEAARGGRLDTGGWQPAECRPGTPSPYGPAVAVDAWLGALGCALPAAEARIAGSPRGLTVAIRWRRSADAAYRSVALETRL